MIKMDDKYILIGIFFILIGFAVLIIGSFVNSSNADAKGGAVILIGPIPIGFGTDKEMLIIALILALVLILAVFFLFKFYQ